MFIKNVMIYIYIPGPLGKLGNLCPVPQCDYTLLLECLSTNVCGCKTGYFWFNYNCSMILNCPLLINFN
jgi:hypothetical protein